MAEPITQRGTTVCRSCASGSLTSVLDLGEQPLSNALVRARDEVAASFPLHLRVCATCALGQVGEFVLPEQIFGDDYPYASGTSSTWVRHTRAYAARMSAELGLGADDLVLEIASNDGTVLRAFDGPRVLGVEPVAGLAALAQEAGVPTVRAFFASAIAEEIVARYGRPRLVVANNVLAHVPDLRDFVAGLAVLCDDRTVITVENPSFLTLLQEAQFDTIYHEHYSYLTAHSVRRVAREHGLDLLGVEHLETHGGSYRYRLARCGVPDDSVARTLAAEERAGLLDPALWVDFARRSRAAIEGLRDWLVERHRSGARIAAYGAAAKGNTFLNAVGAPAASLVYVVDGSPHKQGRFLPGTRIPVVEPAVLREDPADDVLILPWNIAAELGPLVAGLAPDARSWVCLPEMRRLT